MKFRLNALHPLVLKTLGLAGAAALRFWLGTVDYRYRFLGPDLNPHRTDLSGRYIYAMWHENLLMPIHQYARPDICVLISQHADGQLVAEICKNLRVRVARGSTTRGGVEAIRRLLQEGKHQHLAMTPDGPRGPRRCVQQGMIYLAARTGLPIVPVGFGFHRPWRLRSWDRFALPRPWTRGTCVTGAPIFVPANVGKDQLENYRLQVETALALASAAAEQWAESGVWKAPASAVASTAPFPLDRRSA